MPKRIFDFFIALFALIIFSPVILVLILLIYYNLGYPALFKQERPGKYGRPFYIYKFRSMTDEKDENGNLLPNEKRLTPFGKKLRSTSLDELPSLLNVIKGEMSLVGPRPLRMNYLPYFNDQQMKRHDILPGITGYAQVNGRNNNTWDEKLDLDIWYVNNRTLALDFKILFKTFYNVLTKKDITPDNREFDVPFDQYVIAKNKQ